MLQVWLQRDLLKVFDLWSYQTDNPSEKFTIKLPMHEFQMSTFFPVLSPCEKFIALACSYSLGSSDEWRDNKYSDALILSIEDQKIIQVPPLGYPFSNIFFRNSKEILCQNESSVFSISIDKLNF